MRYESHRPVCVPVVVNMVDFIAIAPTRHKMMQEATANELHSIIMEGWPDTKENVPHSIREYWTPRDE